jgi:hypothetical protein
LSTTWIGDQPLSEDFETSAVEFEVQYELIEPKGKGLGVAFQASYGMATRGGDADEIEFGRSSITRWKLADSILPDRSGWRDREPMASASYGAANTRWRSTGEAWRRNVWRIEDLANAGSFDDQNHSIGPTLFYNPSKEDDNVGGEGDDDDDDEKKAGGPAEVEFTFNVGVQFGLTDVVSDTALKFQGGIAF